MTPLPERLSAVLGGHVPVESGGLAVRCSCSWQRHSPTSYRAHVSEVLSAVVDEWLAERLEETREERVIEARKIESSAYYPTDASVRAALAASDGVLTGELEP